MKRGAKRKPPVFYDCNATCGGGLPIEIGWAWGDPATDEILSESHLIRPPSNWDLGSVWDPDVEKLHKITRDELYARGNRPVEIAGRMNMVLAGRDLFSDHPIDDERLWFTMWQASGASGGMIGESELIVMIEPTFKLRQINAYKVIARLAAERGWHSAAFEAAKAEAARIAPKQNRAEADARHLAMLWLMISRGPRPKSVARIIRHAPR